MSLPAVQIDPIILSGGLDLITPTLSLKSGVARQSLNFECGISGGYSRVAGYERFDGHTSPSDPSLVRIFLLLDEVVGAAVGQGITSSGGATGTIAYISGNKVGVTAVTGSFNLDDWISNSGGIIGTITDPFAQPDDPKEDAVMKNAVADIYRASIAAVPGSGPVRGVVEFKGAVYAFRDNEAATDCGIYKSSASGWQAVPLYYSVSFTAGTTEPADGATLTQGGKTATIKRVVRTSGAWAGSPGTAAGQFIITAPVGGNFASGAATVGSTTITLSGAQTQITMLAGGKFEFDRANFSGQAGTIRLYGCDGVNKAFEFDGDVLVPLGPVSAPVHIAVHRKYLFLSQGSSAFYSAPGKPYDWSGISAAGEIATGGDITGMIEMPGGANSGGASDTLCITSRDSTEILYGNTPDDWQLISYNTGTGATAYSLQNMAQTLGYDDRGATSIQAALQYGNFAQTYLTNQVLPFVKERMGHFCCSTLARTKSQYRLHYDDGYSLFLTLVNGKLLGCMPVYYPNPVTCSYEGKDTNGADIMFFGSDNGFVYQSEKGTSFDGEPIDFRLQLNFSNAKGPRTLKRYRKASVEIAADTNVYAEFDFTSILGYDAPEYAQAISDTYGQYVGLTRWDVFNWDSFFWDANTQQPVECQLEGTAENIAFLFSGSSDYVSPFTINSVLVHYTPRRNMR